MRLTFNTNLYRRLTSLSLIVSVLALNLTPIWGDKIHAQFLVSDPPVEVATAAIATAVAADTTRETGRHIADSVAMIAARLAVQLIVKETVSWAQSGFDGNPAYVTDPEQYFTDLADGIAGNYIQNSKELGFLCSPFQTQVRIALRQQYLSPHQFQCTLTGVVGNIEAFYEDFNQGGWDGWFAMTQNNSNNPYGAYLDAQVDLDSRIANAVGLKKEQLDWDQGFLSWQTCKSENVLTQEDIDKGYGEEGYKAGDCYDDGSADGGKKTVTPGSMIKGQLDKVLPSGIESLITVNHVEQLIEAFATGLLKKYVFGPEGLFSGGSSLPTTRPGSSTTSGGGRPPTPTRTTYDQCVANCNATRDQVDYPFDVAACIARYCDALIPPPPLPPPVTTIYIDIDGDGIVDGGDTDGDGEIDYCYYNGPGASTNPPCRGSAQTT